MFIVAQICRSWGEKPPNEGAFLSDTISHWKSPPALLVSQIAAFSVWIISWFVYWLCYSSLWESSKKTKKKNPKWGSQLFVWLYSFQFYLYLEDADYLISHLSYSCYLSHTQNSFKVLTGLILSFTIYSGLSLKYTHQVINH